jgi:hypothetical protein
MKCGNETYAAIPRVHGKHWTNPVSSECACTAAGTLFAAPFAEARVTKITIISTTSAFNGGCLAMSGLTSRYGARQAVSLILLFRQNAVITDIDGAA